MNNDTKLGALKMKQLWWFGGLLLGSIRLCHGSKSTSGARGRGGKLSWLGIGQIAGTVVKGAVGIIVQVVLVRRLLIKCVHRGIAIGGHFEGIKRDGVFSVGRKKTAAVVGIARSVQWTR